MTPTTLLVPTYTQMLKALSAWLDKAQAQLPEGEAQTLLTARLAPDMFPLSTQIRFVCVQAQEGLFHLKDEAFPPELDALLDDGRNAGGHPGTIAEAKARLAEAVALVEATAPEAIEGDILRPIAHCLPNGMILDLTLEQYARDWALPQFFFHVMIAYAILRAQGVDVGKADYVAHMLPFVRPETLPSQ
jgi:uncharacterized protein